MRFRRFLRRCCLVLVCAAALAPAPSRLESGSQPVPATGIPAAIGAAEGGWAPRHLNACALALGLMAGGAFGMPINPMGGSTAFAIGFAVSLFACS